MPQAPTERAAHAAEADIVRSVSIPPRPALLMAVQREMGKDMPHLKKVTELVSRDTAMAGTLLRTANSVFFSPGRRITTIPEAVALIGTNQCAAIMTGLITRRVLGTGGMMMARFWDVSEKRAKGLNFLAREIQGVPADLAYSFGLFCDIGIPLMKAQFRTYLKTLSLANTVACERFLHVEKVQHATDHAVVGAMLAAKWHIAPEVTAAIRLHHAPETLYDATIPTAVRSLVAANFLVEKAIQEFRGEAESLEWLEAGALACDALGVSNADVEQLCAGLTLRFAGVD